MRSILQANGFSQTEGHDWNLLWLNSSCKPYQFEGLNEFQKVNHFPGSFEITRKDKLCFNLTKMQERFGRRFGSIAPETFVIPDEYADFCAEFRRIAKTDPQKNAWIVKPSQGSRGRGIFITEDIEDIPDDDSYVVSRCVSLNERL